MAICLTGSGGKAAEIVCVCVCVCVCVVCVFASSVYDHHSLRVINHMPLSQVRPSFAGDGRSVHPTPHLCILMSCLCDVALYAGEFFV